MSMSIMRPLGTTLALGLLLPAFAYPAAALSSVGATGTVSTPPHVQAPTRAFTLVAEPGRLMIRRGQTVPVWTFNGAVPGPELRVQQGDVVRVTLVNRLPVATTIHWHGLLGPNANDGVAGVTQDAVLPGHRFTYTFVARDPGTYWYHPHQKSAMEVDKGLYGALVILPRREAQRPVIDRPLLLDDWPLAAPAHGSMPGMAMPAVTPTAMPSMGVPARRPAIESVASTPPAAVRPYLADPGMGAYKTFTINGRAYPDTAPIQAPPGALVRLRLINVGYLTHVLHLHGVTYRLVATDGSAIRGPQETSALLPIAAAQRMDIEFRMPSGAWSLHDHSGLPGADDMRVLVGQNTRPGRADERADRAPAPPLLDLTRYGRPGPAPFTLNSRFDRSYRLVLRKADSADTMGGMSMSGMSMDAYTINGASFMHAPPLMVRRGQRVEITFVNDSKAAHPMHLHGHRMQVLVLNGERVTATPLYQDTVVALPGRTTVVAFVADNPGVWMLHCHELHHAAAGMDTLLQYQGSPRLAKMGGPAGNDPE